MTGTQILQQAVTLLGLEDDNTEHFDRMALGCLNQLLADRLYDQNALFRTRGAPEIPIVPTLYDLEDELLFDELFVRECFPYGLAALLIAEDDHTMFDWLMSEYERRAAYYAPCTLTDLTGTDE